jgi:hypothetical protein
MKHGTIDFGDSSDLLQDFPGRFMDHSNVNHHLFEGDIK